MADIFISYLREDIEAAEKLAEALEAHGWSVFWDRRIPAGKRFDDFLDEQLQAARCIIVLWSRRSIYSPWVKDEAAVGRDRGILVPARLDDVLTPFGFRAIQAADLIGWQGDPSQRGFQQLLGDIGAAIEVPASVVLAGMGEPSPRVSQEEEAQQRAEGARKRQAAEEQQREALQRQREQEEARKQMAVEARKAEEQRRKAEAETKRREEAERALREVGEVRQRAGAEAERLARSAVTPSPRPSDTATKKPGKLFPFFIICSYVLLLVLLFMVLYANYLHYR